MTNFFLLVGGMAAILSVAGAFYALGAAFMVRHLMKRRPPQPENWKPVSILKPLHGDEPGLETALESFFRQDYPAPFQLVFGAHSQSDAAIAHVNALRARYPHVDVVLVADPTRHGTNGKVSNLINMAPAAKYDTLVVSDSDIVVAPDYLKQVTAALDQDGVGIVTCLYAGVPVSGVWSGLVAGGIAYNFLPNVAFAVALNLAEPTFGSTIACRRAVLESVGGFKRFANRLADDYEMGRAITGTGRILSVPPMVVGHNCTEASARELFDHEMRWARTIRTIDPGGYLGTGATHTLPLALIALGLLGPHPAILSVLAFALTARYVLKITVDRTIGFRGFDAWLLPVRDVISFGIYLASLTGRNVAWRGVGLAVSRSGTMTNL